MRAAPTEPRIEKGIPIPPRAWSQMRWVRLLKSMKVGDSFLVEGDAQARGALRCGRMHDIPVATRKWEDKGYRVWRVKLWPKVGKYQ